MKRRVPHSVIVVGLLAASVLVACDDKGSATTKTVDAASAAPPAPKNLDLAKAALVTAKAKYAKKEVVEADCGPIMSLKADFAQDKSPEAVKTAREIDVFCQIDVTLEGAVATLKADNEKLAAAMKKKDKTTEQMYAATVKDGCASVKKQLDGLAADKLDVEPKVAGLKAQVDPICSAPSGAQKK